MNVPLFSIIIPVYNVDKYLNEAIDSVLNQSFKNFEVIIINDGSTDDSLKIAYSYQKQDDRIKVITQDNSGLSASRNRGVKKAVGDYLLFLDGDDYIDQNLLEKIWEAINNSNKKIDIIVFSSYLFNDKEKKFVKGFKSSKDNLLFNDIACNKAYRREFWNNYNFKYGYGISYEDSALIPMVVSLTKNIVVLPFYGYFYRCNRINSITNVDAKDKVIPMIGSMLEFINNMSRYSQFMTLSQRKKLWSILGKWSVYQLARSIVYFGWNSSETIKIFEILSLKQVSIGMGIVPKDYILLLITKFAYKTHNTKIFKMLNKKVP